MTEKVVAIDQEIHSIKHLLEVALKNQKMMMAHIWTEGDKLDKPESSEDIIKFEEQEAENYVNNILLPKIRGEEIGIQGFWQGAALNWLKQQALNFIGHTLKKLVIEKAVDFSKWLMDEAEENIIRTYNNSTQEEKETFKNKVKEVFPDAELLKKLN